MFCIEAWQATRVRLKIHATTTSVEERWITFLVPIHPFPTVVRGIPSVSRDFKPVKNQKPYWTIIVWKARLVKQNTSYSMNSYTASCLTGVYCRAQKYFAVLTMTKKRGRTEGNKTRRRLFFANRNRIRIENEDKHFWLMFMKSWSW